MRPPARPPALPFFPLNPPPPPAPPQVWESVMSLAPQSNSNIYNPAYNLQARGAPLYDAIERRHPPIQPLVRP